MNRVFLLVVFFALCLVKTVESRELASKEKCPGLNTETCAVYIAKKGDTYSSIVNIFRQDDPSLTFQEVRDFGPNAYILSQKVLGTRFQRPEDLLRPGYRIHIPRVSKKELAKTLEEKIREATIVPSEKNKEKAAHGAKEKKKLPVQISSSFFASGSVREKSIFPNIQIPDVPKPPIFTQTENSGKGGQVMSRIKGLRFSRACIFPQCRE